MEWYCYDGTGSVYNPLNYYFCPFPICPGPNQKICAIRAFRQLISGVPRPIITPNLQAQIAATVLTQVESANVLLRPF